MHVPCIYCGRDTEKYSSPCTSPQVACVRAINGDRACFAALSENSRSKIPDGELQRLSKIINGEKA